MTSITQPLRIKKEFLPAKVTIALDTFIDKLARQCADQWEASLRKDDLRLTPGDYEELIRHLKHGADITVSMSVKITEKNLYEEWMIAPVPMSQKSLGDYSPEEEREARVEDVADVADEILEQEQRRRELLQEQEASS
jgi:hypothetical protein